MKTKIIPVLSFLLIANLSFATEPATPPRHPSPRGAEVFIISPKNGETVTNPIIVKFGIKGMTLAPAGTQEPNTGHHHLLVDMKTLPPLDQAIPSNENSIHFGKAQTETTLTLSPGPHTLQLLLGDVNHMPHQPPVVSKKIKIVVK